jgi:CubicO group peptidase (beta-lactamase class C family)
MADRLNPAALAAALKDTPGIRGCVVWHAGSIVLEHYRHDIEPAALQPLNSITKSVLGVLIGIALHRGELRDIDQTLTELLPEARTSERRALPPIRLGHLLTMTSGYEWDERNVDACLLHACDHFGDGGRLGYIVGRPRAHPPGTHFEYDSHAAHLLSIVLTRATGQSTDAYARDHLFGPLGITDSDWEKDEGGVAMGGRGLMLSTRDLLRIGQLMLQQGEWAGQRLLPAGYVGASVQARAAGGPPVGDAGYGYLWWVTEEAPGDPTYFASGFGEQLLLVNPRRQRIAAFTSDNSKASKHVRDLWREHVLGSESKPD